MTRSGTYIDNHALVAITRALQIPIIIFTAQVDSEVRVNCLAPPDHSMWECRDLSRMTHACVSGGAIMLGLLQDGRQDNGREHYCAIKVRRMAASLVTAILLDTVSADAVNDARTVNAAHEGKWRIVTRKDGYFKSQLQSQVAVPVPMQNHYALLECGEEAYVDEEDSMCCPDDDHLEVPAGPETTQINRKPRKSRAARWKQKIPLQNWNSLSMRVMQKAKHTCVTTLKRWTRIMCELLDAGAEDKTILRPPEWRRARRIAGRRHRLTRARMRAITRRMRRWLASMGRAYHDLEWDSEVKALQAQLAERERMSKLQANPLKWTPKKKLHAQIEDLRRKRGVRTPNTHNGPRMLGEDTDNRSVDDPEASLNMRRNSEMQAQLAAGEGTPSQHGVRTPCVWFWDDVHAGEIYSLNFEGRQLTRDDGDAGPRHCWNSPDAYSRSDYSDAGGSEADHDSDVPDFVDSSSEESDANSADRAQYAGKVFTGTFSTQTPCIPARVGMTGQPRKQRRRKRTRYNLGGGRDENVAQQRNRERTGAELGLAAPPKPEEEALQHTLARYRHLERIIRSKSGSVFQHHHKMFQVLDAMALQFPSCSFVMIDNSKQPSPLPEQEGSATQVCIFGLGKVVGATTRITSPSVRKLISAHAHSLLNEADQLRCAWFAACSEREEELRPERELCKDAIQQVHTGIQVKLKQSQRRFGSQKRKPYSIVADPKEGGGECAGDPLEASEDPNVRINYETPDDYVVHPLKDFNFILPYEGAKYEIAIPYGDTESVEDEEDHHKLYASADSSFAMDAMTRRSHGGYICFLNGGPVAWKSGLQQIVTLSSCEAEYVAVCAAVCEIKYLRNMLRELGYAQQQPTLIWEDNRAAILVSEQACSSAGRCKHVDIKYKFVARAIRDGEVILRYTPSSQNVADILTKPLTQAVFDRLKLLVAKPNQEDESVKHCIDHELYMLDVESLL